VDVQSSARADWRAPTGRWAVRRAALRAIAGAGTSSVRYRTFIVKKTDGETNNSSKCSQARSQRAFVYWVEQVLVALLLGLQHWSGDQLHGNDVNPARGVERTARYRAMQASFRERGLDVASIDAQRNSMWETTSSDGGSGKSLLPPGPLRARSFNAKGSGPRSERFVALTLPKHVARLADQAAEAVLQTLASSSNSGSEMRVYRTPVNEMHATVFFHARQDGSGRAGSDAVWSEESSWWKEQATSTSASIIPQQSVRLRVEALMLAPS
jgi:hypothetical protein